MPMKTAVLSGPFSLANGISGKGCLTSSFDRPTLRQILPTNEGYGRGIRLISWPTYTLPTKITDSI